MRYGIVLEETFNNFSAYAPDLPGCVATGKTKEEALANIIDAIKFHIQGLKEDGLDIPEQKTYFEYIDT